LNNGLATGNWQLATGDDNDQNLTPTPTIHHAPLPIVVAVRRSPIAGCQAITN